MDELIRGWGSCSKADATAGPSGGAGDPKRWAEWPGLPAPRMRQTSRVRIVEASEAVAGIRSGDQVYVHCAAATPSVLLDALVARAAGAPRRRRRPPPHEGPGPHLAPEMAGHFRHRALFIGPERARAPSTRAAPTTCRSSCRTSRACSSPATLPLDAVLVNATPPDAPRLLLARHVRRGDARGDPGREDGHRPAQPGDAADARRELHPRRRHRPRGRGRRAAVRASGSAPSATSSGGSASTSRTSSPDGATLQLGIGAIPAAVGAGPAATSATSGIHTEMFTDAVVDLVEAGVVTGARKERNRGKIVTAFLMGTQRLYDFVDDNPMVEMRSVDFTNDTHVIRSFSRMTAINSAIEVDLTGQVVADSIGHRLYSGRRRPDGLHPRRGPGRRRAGRSSRCRRRRQAGPVRGSRRPSPGAGVVTTRAHVRTVVTEYGVAELFGRSVRERARALIAIAHPDHRDQLRAEARATHER